MFWRTPNFRPMLWPSTGDWQPIRGHRSYGHVTPKSGLCSIKVDILWCIWPPWHLFQNLSLPIYNYSDSDTDDNSIFSYSHNVNFNLTMRVVHSVKVTCPFKNVGMQLNQCQTIGRLWTPVRQEFSYGIRHVYIVIQWAVTHRSVNHNESMPYPA